MEIFVSKKTKGIKSQIANLVAVAQLDGTFSVSEKKLVYEVGEKNGISRERVKEIIRSKEPIKFKVPDNDSLRFDRIYEAIQMLLAEKEKEEEKLDFCTELAIKLGIRMAVAAILVKKIHIGMQEGKSFKELKQECADFLNY
ncbi:MAG: hypothetical protein MUE33_01480 [Cytophagaceae bacterium]|jgi:hypothetical protein|nr:hypothetical protein [Cytophagaceae bacterium]